MAGWLAKGCGVALLATVAAHPAAALPADNVILRAMDKITARVSTITVPVGGTVGFGSLRITARACDKRPPEETPEASAYLDVVEEKPGEEPQVRFQGWMFASSPALSALEHPVYDIWVLDCSDVTAPDETAGEAADPQSAPEAPATSESSTTESDTAE